MLEVTKRDIAALSDRLAKMDNEAEVEKDEHRLQMLESVRMDLQNHRAEKTERLHDYTKLTHLAKKPHKQVEQTLNQVVAGPENRPNDQLYQMERFLRRVYEIKTG